MDSMFKDLTDTSSGIPSAVSTREYKNIYVGEGVITKRNKDGSYGVSIPGGRQPPARAVFNSGENEFPTGIPVFVVVYNGTAWIMGRIRPVRDEESSDGETSTEKSPNVGNPGDATLRPHAKSEKNLVAEVTVTSGGVVKVKSTNQANITLHPHGNWLKLVSEKLTAYSSGYSLESGKISGKTSAVSLKTLTTETYKTKVGPSRVEVRVNNGSVDSSVVHKLSIDSLATAGGSTAGIPKFGWEVKDDGTWSVVNAKEINLGDNAGEPIVLGKQYVTLQKGIILNMSTMRTSMTAAMAALSATAASVTSSVTGSIGIPVINSYGIIGLAGALTALATAMTVAFATSNVDLQAKDKLFLTATGIIKELVLSDYINAQKVAPVPTPFTE